MEDETTENARGEQATGDTFVACPAVLLEVLLQA